ncbi:MAG: FAD-binding protein, partial [Acidimicrobiia bacterium]
MTGRVDHWRNWGGNQRATPAAVDEPRSLLEVVESIETAATAGQTVKVVASGHSFSDIACTSGRMLRIGALDRIVAIDREAMTATVEAGIPLWRLNEEL